MLGPISRAGYYPFNPPKISSYQNQNYENIKITKQDKKMNTATKCLLWGGSLVSVALAAIILKNKVLKAPSKKLFDSTNYVIDFLNRNPNAEVDSFVSMSLKNMSEAKFKEIFPKISYPEYSNGFIACLRNKDSLMNVKILKGYEIPEQMQKAFDEGKTYVKKVTK